MIKPGLTDQTWPHRSNLASPLNLACPLSLASPLSLAQSVPPVHLLDLETVNLAMCDVSVYSTAVTLGRAARVYLGMLYRAPRLGCCTGLVQGVLDGLVQGVLGVP